jgi:hypothetical protein
MDSARTVDEDMGANSSSVVSDASSIRAFNIFKAVLSKCIDDVKVSYCLCGMAFLQMSFNFGIQFCRLVVAVSAIRF